LVSRNAVVFSTVALFVREVVGFQTHACRGFLRVVVVVVAGDGGGGVVVVAVCTKHTP